VLIGPDNNVYLVIGDVNHFNEAQNMLDRKAPDGTSGILRITQNGKVIQHQYKLGDLDPLNKYYAYGIRNSFGMDFDPLTGNLWDTENGIDCCDEINLVNQGFNSGWAQVQGIWKLNQSERTNRLGVFNQAAEKQALVNFDGKGKYRSPEFIWNFTVGPSALKFLDSSKLGKHYRNDVFVGDVNMQNIYHFDLTRDRTQLSLNNSLRDKIADKPEEIEDIIFAKNLGRVTDIDVGPDGNLYILSHSWNDDPLLRMGSIFKISKR
jgi:glucose/arabinose dehydrogenase